MIKFLLEIICVVILVKVFIFVWNHAPKLIESGEHKLTISIVKE